MVIDKFYFSNGESAESLEEFLEKLRVIDNECFLYHVNDERNDFTSWIRECVGDNILSNRVDKLKDKNKIINTIDKRVNTPAKIKKNIIDKIKEAILNGS